MSIGGGGFGGGGLPYPGEVLQLWGGQLQQAEISNPTAPTVLSDDGTGERQYAIISVGVQGRRSAISQTTRANGLAKLDWDSVIGADAYIVVRDGKEIAGPLRIKGSQKQWTDTATP